MTETFEIYNYLWYFIIYAFLGWCVEVAYAALRTGKVVNRGFLNGPFCPIYGFGMVAILSFFDQLLRNYAGEGHNGLLLFAGGMLITTSIELFGGWVLHRLFRIRWWDYTGRPLNFHGYICAEFSVIWGLGTVFMYKIVHPTVHTLTVSLLPRAVGTVLLVVGYITIAADIAITVAILIGLNKRLTELDELRHSMRSFSDNLSDRIGEGTIRKQNAIAGMQVQAALAGMEARDDLEERRSRAVTRYAAALEEAGERYAAAREEAEQRREALRAGANARAAAFREEYETRTAARREYESRIAAFKDEYESKAAAARDEYEAKAAAARKDYEARTAAAHEAALGKYEATREEAFKKYAERREEAARRYDELKSRIMHNRVFGLHRLLQSYPGSHHERFGEVFDELKKDDE